VDVLLTEQRPPKVHFVGKKYSADSMHWLRSSMATCSIRRTWVPSPTFFASSHAVKGDKSMSEVAIEDLDHRRTQEPDLPRRLDPRIRAAAPLCQPHRRMPAGTTCCADPHRRSAAAEAVERKPASWVAHSGSATVGQSLSVTRCATAMVSRLYFFSLYRSASRPIRRIRAASD
jgi:hypothetical protein